MHQSVVAMNYSKNHPVFDKLNLVKTVHNNTPYTITIHYLAITNGLIEQRVHHLDPSFSSAVLMASAVTLHNKRYELPYKYTQICFNNKTNLYHLHNIEQPLNSLY
jgi:hypothetical protein